MIEARIEPEWDAFRSKARSLILDGVPPEEVEWSDGSIRQLSFDVQRSHEGERPVEDVRLAVPKRYAETGRLAARHTDPGRWDLLYRLLWRIQSENRRLMSVDSDPDVIRALRLAQAIRRDIHKTHAFVRFRKIFTADKDEQWIAWYEPDYDTLELSAPFFVERFRIMRWSILTPTRSAHWDRSNLEIGPGVDPADKPDEDSLEDLWRVYYGAIFNPARLNLRATRAEMPSRKWEFLPEARLIPDLVRESADRVGEMVNRQRGAPDATPFLPETRSVATLREAVESCRGCELWEDATQPVFSEGSSSAKIVLVGEQPGDQEDLDGRPFIGPAGRVLDEAIAEAGLERKDLYLTNAVKHFRFEERGVRRIHKKPSPVQIRACRPWLESELKLVKPEVVVALGATAAQSLFGGGFRVMRDRGRIFESQWAPISMGTLHPSAVLRSGDDPEKYRAMIVSDLKMVVDAMSGGTSHVQPGRR